MTKNDDVVEKFKETIIDMHRGIPIFKYYDLEKIMPDKEIKEYFFEKGVFVKSKKKRNKQEQYFLGVEGINLANNYKMENLTSKIERLTSGLVILTIIITLIGVVQIFFLNSYP